MNVKAVVKTLQAVQATVAAADLQVPRRHLIALAAAIVILVALAWWLPIPNALELRDWATSVGAWFPLVFLATHVVVTTFPFPRTAFTLAAGLLFGPLLGIAIAVAASTVSALLAVLLIRALGWQLNNLVSHPAVDRIDVRLRRRGWPSVIALRLIPAVPFAVLNYAAGASAVRLLPYSLATLFGMVPGTAAVVILGDALTGQVNPLLVLISAATASIGVVVLFYENRLQRRLTVGVPRRCELRP
ncbi:TVP38/TMEM64 family protein [Mycolicibacterium doricum]|uniref:TVP38/TMEM64 family membrane protein n=1 Tax=Mycolicibacterium doricum TaxID=126673 RepID=A0A7I7VU17_9MYCO|nr:TVP38/TMEM64 family protein [Mycolicibacterium doricum]